MKYYEQFENIILDFPDYLTEVFYSEYHKDIIEILDGMGFEPVAMSEMPEKDYSDSLQSLGADIIDKGSDCAPYLKIRKELALRRGIIPQSYIVEKCITHILMVIINQTTLLKNEKLSHDLAKGEKDLLRELDDATRKEREINRRKVLYIDPKEPSGFTYEP